MQTVTVNKHDLLGILRKNRKEHRNIFLKAQEAFRQKFIELVDQQLESARNKRPFSTRELISLQQPLDHTDDYDRVIDMMEMSVDKTIVLDARAFDSFVRDNWEWGHSWAVANSRYVESQQFKKYLG